MPAPQQVRGDRLCLPCMSPRTPFRGRFFYFIVMKQKIPGILFLLAMPLSVLLYIKVEAFSGSEILGLFSAVGLYVLVGLVIALLFNKKE